MGKIPWLTQAMQRYPRTNPFLALMFYESDRRAAGLGALDENKRPRKLYQAAVTNVKWQDLLNGTITWSLSVHMDAHQEWDPPVELPLSALSVSVDGDQYVTSHTVPEKHWERWVTVPSKDLHDPKLRTMIAHELRKLRRSRP